MASEPLSQPTALLLLAWVLLLCVAADQDGSFLQRYTLLAAALASSTLNKERSAVLPTPHTYIHTVA